MSHQGSLMFNGKSLQGDLQIMALQPQHCDHTSHQFFAADLQDTLLDAKLPFQLIWPETGVNLVLTNASVHLRNLQMRLPKEKDSSITAKILRLMAFSLTSSSKSPCLMESSSMLPRSRSSATQKVKSI